MPEISKEIDADSEHVTEPSVLHRHGFPRSTRFPTVTNRGGISRISRVDHYRSALLYRRQPKPRGTFHRVISSFFGGNEQRGAHSASSQARSRASSFGSQPGSSIQGSVPSLDLVSPGAFLFSGPSLQSAGSRNNSASRLPSLTESFDDVYLHCRVHTESCSTVDHSSLGEDSLGSVVGLGLVGRMSDMLLGVNTSVEELSDPLLEGPENETSLDQTPTKSDALPSKLPLLSTANDSFRNPTITQNHPSNNPASPTNRSVYHNMDAIASPLPPSGTLPTEILQTIYTNLNAKDFNAARRTCRSWMMASLSKSLLIAMLTRGGWIGDGALTTARLDAFSSQTTEQQTAQKRPTTSSSEAWIISRYLSRQCALASHWTGNGLDAGPAIVESTEIDFSELADGYAPQKGRASGGTTFTASVCGKYLLVVKETLIYIYVMNDGLLQPLTSVVCPRRVLSVSMNTSVGRDAVAALLEGRMGMVCELRFGRLSPEPASGDTCVEGDGYPPRTSAQPRTPLGDTSDLQYAIDSAEHTSPRVLRSSPYVQHPILDAFNAIELKAHNQGFTLRGTDDPGTHDRNLINQAWNLDLRGPLKNPRTKSGATLLARNIPVESGTSTFYRHLCSEDDPPRNVSICPQRRCVAFGCSTGIELHWIDALTGQSLSRWFPLTSPSDYLYFLSPRPGFESAKKLRLISSAAHPSDRPALNRKFSPNSIARASLGFETHHRQSESSDHLQAIPLSDGHHVLFVDPLTERLSLGCDAPLGGPTKLLRKIIFEPPEDSDNREQSRRLRRERGGRHLRRRVPRIYKAAADLSSGARIVVVYGETIMMYSIPPDVLALSRIEQANESLEVYSAPPFSPTGRHYDHWLNWWDEPTASHSASDNDNPIWPICLSGTEIGRLPDVCELAIQTLPEMTIWAFTYTSQCRTWRLRNYADPAVRTRQYIDRSGLVHDSAPHTVVNDRDVGMHDAPPSRVIGSAIAPHVEGEEWEMPGAERSVVVGFDGSASGVLKRVPGALAVEQDGWVDGIDVSGCKDAWFEGGGDVVSWWEV